MFHNPDQISQLNELNWELARSSVGLITAMLQSG
jgi:hypothetical protein